MKKGKKIVSLLLSLIMLATFALPTFAMEDSTTTQEIVRATNKVNVAKYAMNFVDSMYDVQNFESGNVITLYSENDNISGYCIDIMNGNEHNGYVVVKFSDNSPVVSEFAIEPGVENPYDQIVKDSNLSKENLVFYSVGANEYQVLDQQDDVVYCFESEFKSHKKRHSIRKTIKINDGSKQ